MPRTVTYRSLMFAAVLALGSQAAAFAGQDPALVKKGEEVYGAQKCMTCHQVAGKGNKLSPLDGVGAKLSADDIRAWIVDPQATAAKMKSTKKPPMPNRYSKLPAGDIDALVAYVQSLK